jgi:hypothetical protein
VRRKFGLLATRDKEIERNQAFPNMKKSLTVDTTKENRIMRSTREKKNWTFGEPLNQANPCCHLACDFAESNFTNLSSGLFLQKKNSAR